MGSRRSYLAAAAVVIVALVVAGVLVGRSLDLPSRLAARLSTPAPEPSQPPGTPTAHAYDGTPTVGAIFVSGLNQDHTCTASVIDSPNGDLILTAAHCVAGVTSQIQFAPGYVDGRTPYGVWRVVAKFTAPEWGESGPDEQHYDYAFLRVADERWNGLQRSLQSVVGANQLQVNPSIEGDVTITGYPQGQKSKPITCTHSLYLFHGFPAMNCYGYYPGVSGSPWLVGGPPGHATVIGALGGLQGGGCSDSPSFTSYFDQTTEATYQRATSDAAGGPVKPMGYTFQQMC